MWISCFLQPENKVWGKVMFLHLYVRCLPLGPRGCLPLGPSGGSASGSRGCTLLWTPPRHTPPNTHLQTHTSGHPSWTNPLPPGRDGHWNRQDASYWNAFLFEVTVTCSEISLKQKYQNSRQWFEWEGFLRLPDTWYFRTANTWKELSIP